MSAELLLAFILGIIGGILLSVIVFIGVIKKLVSIGNTPKGKK